jgi:hypothetical protein
MIRENMCGHETTITRVQTIPELAVGPMEFLTVDGV